MLFYFDEVESMNEWLNENDPWVSGRVQQQKVEDFLKKKTSEKVIRNSLAAT